MKSVRFDTPTGKAKGSLPNSEALRERLKHGAPTFTRGHLRGKGVRNLIAAQDKQAKEKEGEIWAMCETEGGFFCKVVSPNSGDDEVLVQRLQQLYPEEDPLCLAPIEKDAVIKVHRKHIKPVEMRREFPGDRLRVVEKKSVITFVKMISRGGEYHNELTNKTETAESVLSLGNTIDSDDDDGDTRTILDNVSEVSSLFQQLAGGDEAGTSDQAIEVNRHTSESPLTIPEFLSDAVNEAIVQPSPGLTRATPPNASPMSIELRPPLPPRERRHVSHRDGVAGGTINLGACDPSPQDACRDRSRLEESFGNDSPLIVVKDTAPTSAGSTKSYTSVQGGETDNVDSSWGKRSTCTPSPLLGGGIFAPDSGVSAGMVLGETPKLPAFSSILHPPPGPGVYRAQPTAAAAPRMAIFADSNGKYGALTEFVYTMDEKRTKRLPAPAPLPIKINDKAEHLVSIDSTRAKSATKVLLGGHTSGFTAPTLRVSPHKCADPPTGVTTPTISTIAAAVNAAAGDEGGVINERNSAQVQNIVANSSTGRREACAGSLVSCGVYARLGADNDATPGRSMDVRGTVSKVLDNENAKVMTGEMSGLQQPNQSAMQDEIGASAAAVLRGHVEAGVAVHEEHSDACSAPLLKHGGIVGAGCADYESANESLCEEGTEGESIEDEHEGQEVNNNATVTLSEQDVVCEASDDEGGDFKGARVSWVYSLSDKQGRRLTRPMVKPAKRTRISSTEGDKDPTDAASFASDLSSIGIVSSPESDTEIGKESERVREVVSGSQMDTSLSGTDREDVNSSFESFEAAASRDSLRSRKKKRPEDLHGALSHVTRVSQGHRR